MERYKLSHFASRHEPFGVSATEPLPSLNPCIMNTAGQTSLFFFPLRRSLPVSSLVSLFHFINSHILKMHFHFIFLMHIYQRSPAHLMTLLFHREQKDPIYLRDKVSQKHSKEQFESAQKIEQEYSKFFTGSHANTTHQQTGNHGLDVHRNANTLFPAGIVQGGGLPYICTQIMTIVDQEQSKVLWTPLGCP